MLARWPPFIRSFPRRALLLCIREFALRAGDFVPPVGESAHLVASLFGPVGQLGPQVEVVAAVLYGADGARGDACG
eukprot:1365990-Pyramimonas_sp.AAC.1